MRISFSNPRLEADAADKFDLLLGLVAELELVVDGQVIYHEVDFPIAELALALAEWLEQGCPASTAFEFSSLESDELGLLWFRPVADGWRVGSVHQEFIDSTARPSGEVESAARRFVAEVDQALIGSAGVDLSSLR
jgi:hypothetical protein